MEAAVANLIQVTLEFLEENLDSAEAWGRLGMVSHAHGLRAVAVPCYEQAAMRDPDNYRWPYLAGEALKNSDRVKAARHYQAAFTLNTTDYALSIAYADLMARRGEYEQANGLYNEAIAMDRQQGFAYIGRARIAFINNQLLDAAKDLETARQFDPRHREIYTLLAQVHMRQGNVEAARLSELLARMYPQATYPAAPVVEAMLNLAVNAGSYVARGKRLTELGDYAGAESAFRLVLVRRPGLAFDYGNLANVLARQGKYDEALDYFDQGLKLNPNDVEMLSNQSLALMETGRFDIAQNALTRAIELDPYYGHAHFNFGVLRYRQRKYSEATRHFSDALSSDPALTQAYMNLGTTYAAMGKFQDAIDVWQRLERTQPDNAPLLFNIALGWLRLGRDANASQVLQQAMDLEPNNKQTATTLIRLLATSQQPSVRDAHRAIAVAKRLYGSRPTDPIVADLLAIAFAANNDFEQALRYGEIALKLGADDRKFTNQVQSRLSRYRKQER